MLKILDEIELKTIEDIEREYPRCVYIFKISDIVDEYGHLYAISDSEDDYVEICGLSQNLNKIQKDGFLYAIGGDYDLEDGKLYVQREIKQ